MNLEAVALAADSATTLTYADGSSKIFTSDNKLLQLANGAPVGVMTYGDAAFIDIPWETIIKEYGRSAKDSRFGSVAEYADDFCRFLREDISRYVSSKHEKHDIESMIYELFNDIESTIQARFQEEIRKNSAEARRKNFSQFQEETLAQVTGLVIAEYYDESKSMRIHSDAPIGFEERMRRSLRAELSQARKEVFERRLTPTLVRRLNSIAIRAVCGFHDDIAYEDAFGSGIVIAGFGQDEIFPSLIELQCKGLVQGVLIYRVIREESLSYESRVQILPFAQTDTIDQFLWGTHPEFDTYFEELLSVTLDKYLGLVIEGLRASNQQANLATLQEGLFAQHSVIVNSVVDDFTDRRKNRLYDDIMSMVEYLPRERLAEMAETLVSLTSLRRRVTREEESVGGPTDVAVITKGGGFQWVKRKEQFETGQ